MTGAHTPAVRRLVSAALVVAVLGVAGCTDTVDGRPDGTGSPTSKGRGAGSKRSTAPDPSSAAFTDLSTASHIRTAASRALVATNTYDYRTLPTFLAKGSAVSTGAFRTQFVAAVATLTPAATKQQATQTATVNDVGLGDVSADGATASVIAFLQVSATRAGAAPSVTPSAVSAQLTRSGDTWLLSAVTVTPTAEIGRPPGTSGLTAAVSAAETAARLLSSYRRASFDADYAAALASTTGALRTSVEGLRQTTLTTLTTGKFDLSGIVRTSGVEKAAGKRAVVLVALDGYRSTSSTPNRQNLIVTVTLRGGTWLASDVTAAAVR